MKNRTEPNTIIGTLILGVAILISGWYVYDLQYLPNSEVTVLGLPYEGGTIASLQAITELKQKHPSRTQITYIPYFESDGETISIPETFQVPEELQENTIQEGIFLQELIKRSPSQAYDYLLARSSNRDTLEWQSFALYVNEDLQSLITDIEDNQEKFAQKYEEEYEFATNFLSENNIQAGNIAATILNEQIHNIGTAPTTYTLRTSITKEKLRQENGFFGEDAPSNLFGLEYASATPQLEGFNEAYQEIDCNDQPDAYGTLEDGGTLYSRCEYQPAEELDVKIVYYQDYEPQEDPQQTAEQAEQIVRRFLQANFKNLTVSEWQEEDYGRDIGATKSENELPPFSVLIDEEVKNTPPYQLFSEQNILLQLSEDKYYLNTEQVLQF